MHKLSQIIRSDNWFQSKIPPILAVGYATILLNEIPSTDAYKSLVAACISIFSVASYGHIINDIFDIDQDIAVGKHNSMRGIPRWRQSAISILCICVGVSSFFITSVNVVPKILLALNFLLPTIYSIPPFRLKERGFMGVIADALGVHTIPVLFIICIIAFTQENFVLPYFFIIVVGFWSFFVGLRGIIIHQVADSDNDKATNVSTFAEQRSPKSLRLFVVRCLFPFEVLFLLLLLWCVVPQALVVQMVLAIYLLGELCKRALGWNLPIFFPAEKGREKYIPLLNNEFYEVWFPFALVLQLTLEHSVFFPLFFFHIAIFLPSIMKRIKILRALVLSIKAVLSRD